MLQRVLSVVLSLTIVLSANPILFAAGAAGQITGVATLQSGEHVAGQIARLRSLDNQGDAVTITTVTSGTGEFSFAGVNAGSYVVELVSNGAVSGTSAPVLLTSKNMTAGNVRITAFAAPAAAAVPVVGGSFWTSTLGLITVATLAAGITTAFVVTKDDASGSK
jgi:hypothetical protein